MNFHLQIITTLLASISHTLFKCERLKLNGSAINDVRMTHVPTILAKSKVSPVSL